LENFLRRRWGCSAICGVQRSFCQALGGEDRGYS
jgi:hypothetical protein